MPWVREKVKPKFFHHLLHALWTGPLWKEKVNLNKCSREIVLTYFKHALIHTCLIHRDGLPAEMSLSMSGVVVKEHHISL